MEGREEEEEEGEEVEKGGVEELDGEGGGRKREILEGLNGINSPSV